MRCALSVQILLRDSMVAPQCEDLSYSWMISEAGNWVSRDVVPLAFVPDQVQSEQTNHKERRESQLRREGSVDRDASGVGPSVSLPGIPFQYSPDDLGSPPLSPGSRVSLASVSLPLYLTKSEALDDLRRPLIESGEEEEEELDLEKSPRASDSVIVNFTDAPPAVIDALAQPQTTSSSDSDTGIRPSEELDMLQKEEIDLLQKEGEVRVSRRGKVFTFGKKMGTRLEEKRRSVLEKMRDRSHQG